MRIQCVSILQGGVCIPTGGGAGTCPRRAQQIINTYALHPPCKIRQMPIHMHTVGIDAQIIIHMHSTLPVIEIRQIDINTYYSYDYYYYSQCVSDRKGCLSICMCAPTGKWVRMPSGAGVTSHTHTHTYNTIYYILYTIYYILYTI